jgi:hypothetical protein
MTVTAFRPQDVTGALRARRYRARRKINEVNAAVTVDAPPRHAICTAQMCTLSARLRDGHATPDDARLASRLIMAFVNTLAPDSTIEIAE